MMNSLKTCFLFGIALALPACYGLYRLFFFSKPFLKERWIFFFLLFLLIVGITLPIFSILNKSMFESKFVVPQTVIRESIAAAILTDLLVWFRIGRVLNATIIFLLVGGFAAGEMLLRAREKIEFRPGFEKKDKDKEDIK